MKFIGSKYDGSTSPLKQFPGVLNFSTKPKAKHDKDNCFFF